MAVAATACSNGAGAVDSSDPASVARAYFAALQDERWSDAGDLVDPAFFRDSLQGASGFDGRKLLLADPEETAAEYLRRMDPRTWFLDRLREDAAEMPCYRERLRATFETPPMVHRTVLGTRLVREEWAEVDWEGEVRLPRSPYHSYTPPESTRSRSPTPVRLHRTEDGWRIRDRSVLQAGLAMLNLDPDDACVREAYRRFYADSSVPPS